MQPGNIFGVGFGLYLHFDQHLTLDKILQINQAVMTYNKVQDNFRRRILLRNPFVKRDVVKVPRIAPARNQLEPQIRAIEATIGVQASENGRVAFRLLSVVVQEMVARTINPVSADLPALPFFLGGELSFPLCLSTDATGKGKVQISTAMVRSPYLSKLAAVADIIGVGNVDDGRAGCKRLFGTNRDYFNELICTHDAPRESMRACAPCRPGGSRTHFAGTAPDQRSFLVAPLVRACCKFRYLRLLA